MDNENLNAIENINIIKGAIEESKIYYHGLYKLCFILGIYHTIFFLLRFGSIFYPHLVNFNIILFPIFTGIIFLYYIFIYNIEKNFSNKYYLSIINSWSLIAIIVPFSISIIELFQYFFFKGSYIKVSNNYLSTISKFSNVLLFSILIIVCSNILEKKYLRLLSIILLFAYLLLDSCFINLGLPISIFNSNDVILSIVSIYYFFLFCIGYIVIGLLLKKKVTQ